MSIYYYIAVACIKIYNFTEISWFGVVACRMDEKHGLGLKMSYFTTEEAEIFKQVLGDFDKAMAMSNLVKGSHRGSKIMEETDEG